MIAGPYPWDEDFKRCPWSLFSPSAELCVSWWQLWRTLRALPFAGGLMEQPAYVLEAIQACEAAQAETEKEQLAELEKA